MNAMSCAGVYSGVQCKSFEAIHSKSLSILILLMSANVCQYICIEQLQLRNWQGKLKALGGCRCAIVQVPQQQNVTESNRKQQKTTEGKSASQKSLCGLTNCNLSDG
jgi:hypothetical protein